MMFELRNGTVTLGDWTVFQDLNLKVEAGEIVSILGPSGCGKITLLFQQPVLYPHLNVSQNIALGAARRSSKAEVNRKVEAVLNAVGLDGFQARGTAGLSGGEAQRVAFGRALMQEPCVMLLDEPFASVDVQRRMALANMTRTHLKERGITAVHVTHDREEAAVLSDRIIEWKDLVSLNEEDGDHGEE